MNASKARRTAIKILEEIKELLDEKGIVIPSDDREGREEEACLYSTEYHRPEDTVTDMLVEGTRPQGKGRR